jgi:hypothetical protein
MNATLFSTGDFDCTSVMAQSFNYVDDAIKALRVAPEPVTPHAEILICIEANSLVIAFKELTQEKGLDTILASRVQPKLLEALNVLKNEPACIDSVRKPLEKDFSEFVNRMNPEG